MDRDQKKVIEDGIAAAVRRAGHPLRPHHLDQCYLEERFKALEDRVAALERARWPHHR